MVNIKEELDKRAMGGGMHPPTKMMDMIEANQKDITELIFQQNGLTKVKFLYKKVNKIRSVLEEYVGGRSMYCYRGHFQLLSLGFDMP